MKEPITALIIDEEQQLTLFELSDICHTESHWIIELVEHGVLTPEGSLPEHWRFTGLDISRSQKAWRIQHDLHINIEALALVLDLLDDLDDLRAQLNHFEKLHGRN